MLDSSPKFVGPYKCAVGGTPERANDGDESAMAPLALFLHKLQCFGEELIGTSVIVGCASFQALHDQLEDGDPFRIV
jgi:hypothetical protein